MSIIFGICKPVGNMVTEQELQSLAASTRRYASEGTFMRVKDRIGMCFQPFHTAERSRLESTPNVDFRGNVLVFDGRLDNHKELKHELQVGNHDISDSSLILAAFMRWHETCFSRLIGDWALALWSGADQVLYLARDHAGTRTLFFQEREGTIQWSTYLETFFASGTPQSLDKEYAACFLASIPIRDRTPYKGIRAVLPAHYVVVQGNKVTTKPHWSWMAEDSLCYKSDVDYEEHFLRLFKTAVERRTCLGEPVLAELSGGMDSSSIVCMSDHIRRERGATPGDFLDTLSYFDDTEPNWNEMPYVSIVEARRGKVGVHAKTSYMYRTFEPLDPSQGVCLFPGAHSSAIEREMRFRECIAGPGYRVILSGIGGDEVLGGVPTPSPELADYLVSGNLLLLLRRTTQWCLASRTPLIHMLFNTAKFALNLYREPHADLAKLPPWLNPEVRKLCIDLTRKDTPCRQRSGVGARAIANGRTWWAILETLPHLTPLFLTRLEYRYPYLDRNLVDFLFRIPREQLVRPGRRRSLMRRALKDIVPTEIIERRRKAFLSRGPLALICNSQQKIEELFAHSLSASCGFIDQQKLHAALELTVRGKDPRWWSNVLRVVGFELWLRSNHSLWEPSNTTCQIFKFMPPSLEADKLRAGEVGR